MTEGKIEIHRKSHESFVPLKEWANSVDICLWDKDDVSKAFIHIYQRPDTDTFIVEVHKSCTIRSPEDIKLTL